MDFQENAISGSTARTLLEDLSSNGTPAQLHIQGTEVICKLRFAAVTEETVTFTLVDEVETPQLGQVCSISFTYGDRPFIFLSSVVDFCGKESKQQPHFVLRLPTIIVGVELRRAFRVPIVESTDGLSVSIVFGESQSWTPRVLDISLAGVQVEFTEDPSPDLPILARVQVELNLGDEHLLLRGVIRRRDEGRYGVFFPEVLRGGELDPPAMLRKIVARLERRWLNYANEHSSRVA
jgi:hypothetical protein